MMAVAYEEKSESSALSSLFSEVETNFQRVQEFGWYLPMPMLFDEYTFHNIVDNGIGYKQAAVMFLVANCHGSLHVLLSTRSHSVRAHKGRINNAANDLYHK